MAWWNKVEAGAGRWVFDQDRLGYYLMMAVVESYGEHRQALLDLMTEEQRAMARKAKDGTWKRC